jgi:hypothetical protein
MAGILGHEIESHVSNYQGRNNYILEHNSVGYSYELDEENYIKKEAISFGSFTALLRMEINALKEIDNKIDNLMRDTYDRFFPESTIPSGNFPLNPNLPDKKPDRVFPRSSTPPWI